MKIAIAHAKLAEECTVAQSAEQSLFVLPSKNAIRQFKDVEYRDKKNPALLMLTSGTTGKSKVVVIPWKRVSFRIDSVVKVFGDAMEKTMLLTNNSRNYFHARELMMAAAKKYQVVDDITEATCVVFFGKGYFDFKEQLKDAKNLKLIISCGYLMENELWKELRSYVSDDVKIITRYGATELGSVTYTDGEEVKNGNIGKPFPGVEVRVENGEIQVKTGGVASQYIGNELPLTEDGWYKTGDKGSIDKEGNLHIVNARRKIK